MITEIAEVLHEDIPDRLPLMHDIQHVIDLVPGVGLFDLPHYMMDSTIYIELEGQVDEL